MKVIKFKEFLIILSGFIILLFLYYFSYLYIEKDYINYYKNSIYELLKFNALFFSKDIDVQYFRNVDKDFQGDKKYKNYYLWANELIKKSNLKYIYILKKVNDKYYFVFDTDPEFYDTENEKVVNLYKEYKEYPEELVLAYNTTEMVFTDIYKDEFGYFVSCFYKIFDDLVIGIDISASQYKKKIDEVRFKRNIIFLINIIFIILIIKYTKDNILSILVIIVENIINMANFNFMLKKVKNNVHGLGKLNDLLYETSLKLKEDLNKMNDKLNELFDNNNENYRKLDEITKDINNLSEDLVKTSSRSKETDKKIKETITYIELGLKYSDESVNSIIELSNKASNIKSIIKLINEIAFQTNILALNASIEASKAGEYGKGFNVVADQVKNLAVKVSENSKNISMIIEDINNTIQHSGLTVEETQSQFKLIKKNIEELNKFIEQLAKHSKNESERLKNISMDISNLKIKIDNNNNKYKEIIDQFKKYKFN